MDPKILMLLENILETLRDEQLSVKIELSVEKRLVELKSELQPKAENTAQEDSDLLAEVLEAAA